MSFDEVRVYRRKWGKHGETNCELIRESECFEMWVCS